MSDEVVLNMDCFLGIDPAAGVRERAKDFLFSRSWATDQIFYNDQSEPEYETNQGPVWSLAFTMGLDHIKTTTADWCADVAALMSFVQAIQVEQAAFQHEFLVEVRYRSKPWYSQHITFIDDKTVDAATACEMIKRVV